MKLNKFMRLIGIFILLVSAAYAGQHKQPDQKSIWTAEPQKIVVEDFSAKGLILDIGGGGEGVIGQLKRQQVVAIDLNKRELVEAPAGPLLKIVMDARDLKFLDGSFATATVFFTFMYIKPADHRQVLRELHRVLEPGGRLLIWDVVFPKLEDKTKGTALFPVSIKLPAREILSGYGVGLPGEELGPAHFEKLARETGFTTVSKKTDQRWFFMELVKPAASKSSTM